MSRTISNEDDVIDSREVIERIEELEGERDSFMEDADDKGVALTVWSATDGGRELIVLQKVAEEGESSPDWQYGETLIRESYFTKYIEELIADCYEFPKELTSGNWPWRHIAVDYKAAAEEAKVDYMEVDFDGVTYLIRA